MRTFIQRAFRSNPTAFISTFGIWSLVVGTSLIMPGDSFETAPSWRSLQLIYARDMEWGVFMVLMGILLLVSIRLNKLPQRASIALACAIVWMLIGASMLINAAYYHIFSVVGAFSIWCALNGMFAVELWVTHTDGEAG